MQEETDNLNKSVSIKGIETIINNFPEHKLPGPVSSLANSAKHLRKKLYQSSIVSLRG